MNKMLIAEHRFLFMSTGSLDTATNQGNQYKETSENYTGNLTAIGTTVVVSAVIVIVCVTVGAVI